MRPERGAISLRKTLPTCAMPKGITPAFCSKQNLKLRKMPCAVSGLRYPVRLPDGPIGVDMPRTSHAASHTSRCHGSATRSWLPGASAKSPLSSASASASASFPCDDEDDDDDDDDEDNISCISISPIGPGMRRRFAGRSLSLSSILLSVVPSRG